MASAEHVSRLRTGVDSWNAWRSEHDGVRPDLREADLRKADLRGADLHGVDLTGANLTKARLGQANLTQASLAGANLMRAILRKATIRCTDLRAADLGMADLREADVSGADLRGANIRAAKFVRASLRNARLARADLLGANLSRADLAGAQLSETLLADVNLRDAAGLEACVHRGPSVVDHRTLTRSGSLPLQFLRGCGLPDEVIRVLPTVLGAATRYRSCFISYASADEEFAGRLHTDLQRRGIRCWFAPHDMRIGDKVLDAVDDAIVRTDRVVLILSQAAIASGWVEDEVTRAFAEERRRSETLLLPVRIDDAVLSATTAWATKLRDGRNIGDFTGYPEPACYRRTLERLVLALTIDAEAVVQPVMRSG